MPNKQIVSVNQAAASKLSRGGLLSKILLSFLVTILIWPIFEIIVGEFVDSQPGFLTVFTVLFNLPLFIVVAVLISLMLHNIRRFRDKLWLYCLLPTPIISLIFRASIL
jgi:hypothetical protein